MHTELKPDYNSMVFAITGSPKPQLQAHTLCSSHRIASPIQRCHGLRSGSTPHTRVWPLHSMAGKLSVIYILYNNQQKNRLWHVHVGKFNHVPRQPDAKIWTLFTSGRHQHSRRSSSKIKNLLVSFCQTQRLNIFN